MKRQINLALLQLLSERQQRNSWRISWRSSTLYDFYGTTKDSHDFFIEEREVFQIVKG